LNQIKTTLPSKQQQGNKEISRDNHHPKGGDCSYNTSDEDNKNPRPAKWRKLPSMIQSGTDSLALMMNTKRLLEATLCIASRWKTDLSESFQ
jgi:hypothetical protein